jgi:hypothetical protein
MSELRLAALVVATGANGDIHDPAAPALVTDVRSGVTEARRWGNDLDEMSL